MMHNVGGGAKLRFCLLMYIASLSLLSKSLLPFDKI